MASTYFQFLYPREHFEGPGKRLSFTFSKSWGMISVKVKAWGPNTTRCNTHRICSTANKIAARTGFAVFASISRSPRRSTGSGDHTMNAQVHERARPVLTSLVITTLAAVPWILAVLPLTFNGIQQVEESGSSGTGSAGLGITMLTLAALPLAASVLVLTYGLTARTQVHKTVQTAAAALFFGGLVSFLFAVLLAMA
ncbi:hypothetical protein ACGFS9_30495 [Streptomyces sp. NPDC048566]|uniref:hypothetical protein n=1 Tax=Streptomyces sp. NPDC048566 TaxID=3365569 RepID=UPI00371E64DC